MKKIHLIILANIFISCSPKTKAPETITTSIHISSADTYGNLAEGIPKFDSLVIRKSGIDTLSIGKYAVTKKKVLSTIKTGYWHTYYPNGSLKDEGEYKMGTFKNCGAGGFFIEYYHYKIGTWKYYDQTRKLLYELDYKPDSLHVDTNCRGGDELVFGLIKDHYILELKYGLTPDDIFQLQKVEKENKDGEITEIAIPISGELLFYNQGS